MDEKRGLALIEELKRDAEKFCQGGNNAYELLHEYYQGLSYETLRELLCSQDKRVRQCALWMASELDSDVFIKEVVPQMYDDDPLICYYAMEIIACYSGEEYTEDFLRIFTFFEHPDFKIRKYAIFLISNLSIEIVHKAYECPDNQNILNDSHKKGLLSLVHMDNLTATEITDMLNSDDDVIRRYGIIAATKLYEKYPEIVKEAVNADDLHVQEQARVIMQAKAKRDQYFRNRQQIREESGGSQL